MIELPPESHNTWLYWQWHAWWMEAQQKKSDEWGGKKEKPEVKNDRKRRKKPKNALNPGVDDDDDDEDEDEADKQMDAATKWQNKKLLSEKFYRKILKTDPRLEDDRRKDLSQKKQMIY